MRMQAMLGRDRRARRTRLDKLRGEAWQRAISQ